MSSNIKVSRICEHCGGEFTARTTVTRFCSDDCAKRAYKARKRAEKVEKSEKETFTARVKPYSELKAQPYLKVREAAQLLNISVRTTYRLIETGVLPSLKFGDRLTRIRQSDIEKLY